MNRRFKEAALVAKDEKPLLKQRYVFAVQHYSPTSVPRPIMRVERVHAIPSESSPLIILCIG